MRFKLGKFWSGIGFSGLLAASVIAFSPNAFATLTVTYVPNGSPGPLSFPAIMSTCGVPPLPAPCAPVTTVVGTLFNGVAKIDSGLTGTLDVNDPNTLLFNVIDNEASFAGATVNTPAMLVITTSGSSGGSGATAQVQPVPILQYQSLIPSGASSQATWWDPVTLPLWGNPVNSANTVFRAVAINPNVPIVVGVNVREICDDYLQVTGSQAAGCNTQLVEPKNNVTVGTGQVATLNLTFGIYIAPTSVGPTGDGFLNIGTTPPPPVDGTVPIQINLSNTGPAANSLVCNLGAAERPGDASMIVDGTQFSINPTGAISGVTDGLQQVFVLAKQVTNVPPALTPTAASVNSGADALGPLTIDRGIPILPNITVGPFQNTTSSNPGNAINYAVGFVGEDGFGFLVDNSSACAYQFPFQTAAILGFLDASKCFIATATFRSMDSPPLVLLREFRDQFLEHFGMGRGFVRWYYRWSPGAAEWLIMNPEFRFPVFLALIPLQTLAWLILNPMAFILLGMAALSVLGYALLIRVRFERNQELSE